MSQPTPYTPTTDFSQQEANNAAGRSTVNTAALDAEFANIETTLDVTVNNIALIQRDDGKLNDELVDINCLNRDVLNLIGGFVVRGDWTTATAYAVNDIVAETDILYWCSTAHTSSASFATDSANWKKFGFKPSDGIAAAAAAAAAAAVAQGDIDAHVADVTTAHPWEAISGGVKYAGGNVDVSSANAGGARAIRVINNSTASGTQSRLDLSTGSANSYVYNILQEGVSPTYEITCGIGVTGGMTFTSGATNAPIVFKQYGSERFRVGDAGQWGVGGANYGTSGQAFVSNGPSAAPSWQTISQYSAVSYTSGRYYGPASCFVYSACNFSSTLYSGKLCLIPIVVTKTQLFSAVSCYVSTSVSANIRLGIYADNNGVPGSLLYDAGTASFTGVGAKDVTLNQSLVAGVYWLAFITDAVTGNIKGVSGASGASGNSVSNPATGATSMTGSGGILWAYGTQTYGALPANPPALTYVTNQSGTEGPALYLKV